MEFRILGPLEVRDGDRAISVGGGRQRALLALLVLNANETVSTDRLVEELWGGLAPATAPKVVQNHISQLRRTFADGLLVTEGSGYTLRLEPGSVDLDRFERLLEEGRRALARSDAQKASVLLREALALWRGPPLADFAFESFAQTEIARLEERRLVALEERIEADLALGLNADLVGEVEAVITKHPLRERLRGQLMLALYRCGRQSEALNAYQQARRTLVDELGIEPGGPLRELHQAILQQDPALDLAAAAAAAESAAEEPRGAFVGREPELAELLAGLEDVLAGRGRLFLLVGEPGIGKSRLAEELTAEARARGANVLVGRCWEAGGAPAYWPWVQSLRGYVRDADPEALGAQLGHGVAELAQIVPELRGRFPDVPSPPPLDSESARFRLFDATVEFLRNASESRPIVLVLDDLHAADTPSLLLLQFLARELGSMPVLLLGAYRDVDPIPGQPLAEMLAEVVREPVSRRLALGGLSKQAVKEYVELTASEIDSPEVVTALYEETEGNPLFVGETVRLLALEGVRSGSTGMKVAIPQTVRDVIVRRLAHLSEECKRVLVLASVLGRELVPEALARMSGLSEDELLETLDEAMAARVVSDVPGGPGRLRFAHVVIRDTLYEELTTVRRVRLHRLATEATEAVYGEEAGPHLAELAHHAIAGSDFEKGLRYARHAADRALALLAYEEAARLYVTALEALDLASAPDDETRCQLLLSLGDAQMRAGNTRAGKEIFVEAAGIARRLGLHRELALAAGGYAREDMYLRAGRDTRIVPLLEEGLAALSEEDVELRARLLARLAGALRDEPTRDRRDRISREAVELARRTGNLAALAYALDGRVPVIIAPDTIAECLAIANELCEVAARIGDVQRLAHGHLHRVIALLMLGRVKELEPDLDTRSRITDELKQPSQLWEVPAGQAALALAAGRLTEADELVPQAFALGEGAKPEVAIPVVRIQRYTLSEFRGSLEEVEPEIRDLVAEYPARPAFRCALVHLHARLGRLPEARQALADFVRDDCSALPFDQEWLYGMSLLAEAAAFLGDSDAAGVLYELLLPYATFNAADWPEGIRGSISRYLGLLATTTKRWQDAELHFEAGLAMNAEWGFRPWLAYTQYDYARMLQERGEPGDSERAGELLAASKALSQEVGMTALTAEISSLPH
jgi:DNA-binding SARP family transcriptional activator